MNTKPNMDELNAEADAIEEWAKGLPEGGRITVFRTFEAMNRLADKVERLEKDLTSLAVLVHVMGSMIMEPMSKDQLDSAKDRAVDSLKDIAAKVTEDLKKIKAKKGNLC